MQAVKKKGNTGLKLSRLVAGAIAVFACGTVWATTVYYPVPLRGDIHPKVPAELAVTIILEEEIFTPAISPDGTYDLSDPDDVASAVLNALGDNSLDEYSDLAGNESWGRIWLDRFWTHAFSKFESLNCSVKIDRVITLGDFRYYTATCSNPVPSIPYPGFNVLLRKSGNHWFDYPPGVALPWMQTLAILREAQIGDANSFQDKGSCAGAHVLDIAIPDLGDESTPCYKICFDGVVPTWGRKIFQSGEFIATPTEAPPVSESLGKVVQFYRDTMLVLHSLPAHGEILNSVDGRALRTRISDDGFERLKELVEYPEQLSEFRNLRDKDTNIQYIIDADPYYFIVFSTSEQLPYTALSIDTIVRHEDTFRWVDFVRSSKFVQMLEYPPVMNALVGFVAAENN